MCNDCQPRYVGGDMDDDLDDVTLVMDPDLIALLKKKMVDPDLLEKLKDID